MTTQDTIMSCHVMSSHQEQRHNLRSWVYRHGTPGLEREMYNILRLETLGNPKGPSMRYIDRCNKTMNLLSEAPVRS
jgi:hypothetical protein